MNNAPLKILTLVRLSEKANEAATRASAFADDMAAFAFAMRGTATGATLAAIQDCMHKARCAETAMRAAASALRAAEALPGADKLRAAID